MDYIEDHITTKLKQEFTPRNTRYYEKKEITMKIFSTSFALLQTTNCKPKNCWIQVIIIIIDYYAKQYIATKILIEGD